jgi:ribosomal protein S20
MVANTAVRNLIRESKIHQLHNVMQTASKEGMQTLNQDLTHLVKREIISREEALNRSSNQEQLPNSSIMRLKTSNLNSLLNGGYYKRLRFDASTHTIALYLMENKNGIRSVLYDWTVNLATRGGS